MMHFGTFDNGREYVFETPKTPYSWINYLGTSSVLRFISSGGDGARFYREAYRRRWKRYRDNSVLACLLGLLATLVRVLPAVRGSLRENPVFISRIETLADGIAAPLASVTKPVIELVIVWVTACCCRAGPISIRTSTTARVR